MFVIMDDCCMHKNIYTMVSRLYNCFVFVLQIYERGYLYIGLFSGCLMIITAGAVQDWTRREWFWSAKLHRMEEELVTTYFKVSYCHSSGRNEIMRHASCEVRCLGRYVVYQTKLKLWFVSWVVLCEFSG